MSAAEKRQNGCMRSNAAKILYSQQLNLPHAHSLTLRQAAVSSEGALYKAENKRALL
jgi:hypothetical protein